MEITGVLICTVVRRDAKPVKKTCQKIWNALVSATFQPMWHNLLSILLYAFHYNWLKNVECGRENSFQNQEKILIEKT